MEFESRGTFGVSMFILGAVADYIIFQSLDFLKNPFFHVLGTLRLLDYSIISIVIIGGIIITLNVLKEKRSKRLTKLEVYGHNKPPFSLDQFLGNAKNEIFFCGITLESLNHKIPSIKKAMEKGVKIRLLVCDPDSDFMPEIENVVDSRNTAQRITGLLGMLEKLKEELGDQIKDNLEIKTYKQSFPTHSAIILDPHSTHDVQIQFEPYFYGTPQEERILFKVSTKKEQRQISNMLLESFERLWRKGGTTF